MLLALLWYGYATGAVSSPKLKHAIYDSVAFRIIAANQHPNYHTIAYFRRRSLTEIEVLFTDMLRIAAAHVSRERGGSCRNSAGPWYQLSWPLRD